MASYNHVTLVGNLTRDPELRYTPGGAAVCEFAVAVNRKWKSRDGDQKEEVGFFDVVTWGRTAEVAAEYLKKGRPVLVAGRLTQDRWEAQDGTRRSKVKVTAEQIQFLGAGRGSEGSSDRQEQPAPWDAPGEDTPF